MIAQGRVQNGVVVLANGVSLPEGQIVSVIAPPMADAVPQLEAPVADSQERHDALRRLIGIWKTDQPPTDEQVERVLDQEKMRKYG
jgi:hypothetical protein